MLFDSDEQPTYIVDMVATENKFGIGRLPESARHDFLQITLDVGFF